MFSCVKPQTKAHKSYHCGTQLNERTDCNENMDNFNLPSFESEVQSGLGRMELNGQIIDCHENSYIESL